MSEAGDRRLAGFYKCREEPDAKLSETQIQVATVGTTGRKRTAAARMAGLGPGKGTHVQHFSRNGASRRFRAAFLGYSFSFRAIVTLLAAAPTITARRSRPADCQ